MTPHNVDALRPNGKSRQLRIRAEPAEKAAFDEAARLSGLTLSAWLRSVCREAAEKRLASAGKEPGWR